MGWWRSSVVFFFFITLQLKYSPSHSYTTHIDVDSKNRILFLHIGKAGGGTITDIIKKNKLESRIDIWHPQGVLTDELFTLYDHILINIRDPVDRAVSAINFECFSQLSKHNSSKSCCTNVASDKLKLKCEERAALSDSFEGSPNKIGEALIGNDVNRKKDAEYLMRSFIHSKMSISEHVGGVDTLSKLVMKSTNIYLVVLGDSFLQQVKYQLGRILQSYAATKQERIAARQFEMPQNLAAHLHQSHSNYSSISHDAAKGFARFYADDFAAIRYLGMIGCGPSAGCMKDVLKIVRNGMVLSK